MKPLKELAFFSALLDGNINSAVQDAIDAGRVPIGYNCSMVPLPLLSVGNLFPVWLRMPETVDTEVANFYLSPFSCSYSRAVLQNAVDGGFDHLGGLVFAESCVHIDRALHNIEESGFYCSLREKPIHMLSVPRKNLPAYEANYVADLRKLGQELAAQFGVDTGDEAVREQILAHNEFVAILKEIADLRLEAQPRITGTELHTLLIACRIAPVDVLRPHVERLREELLSREPDAEVLPRIMILGSDLDSPKFTELVEKQGCRVVADRYCWGSLPGLEPICADGDPYEALAAYTMQNTQCPRMMERSEERLDYMKAQAAAYRVDGIVLEVMKFCDLWGWEVLKNEQTAAEIGIPSVKIEREYAFTGEGQMRTRVQAFIERLKHLNLDASQAEQEAKKG